MPSTKGCRKHHDKQDDLEAKRYTKAAELVTLVPRKLKRKGQMKDDRRIALCEAITENKVQRRYLK